ncbi:type II secretory pathway component PulK [Kitasatospora gansuensis]|uniref:Type II secretory pathway component PulK n=2 Tax=Kitasatospora TaxID=2063 RepID=A0A7W7SAZ3_9ACTN|nr:hypothetical protein [Kitasatospora gansuensis]MBB4946747.1 type II secretory pathway component PulK [Kitasatospora gansuensis]
MSQPANQATTSTPTSGSTANPRRTSLASIEDFGQLPGVRAAQGPREYATTLPMVTANPRRTVLSVAPAPRLPQD